MYAKVFAQMYDGSLCTQGPWEALVTFQQFLVLADQEGAVDMTAEAIARRTTVPLEIIKKGIETLVQPDPQSRTPTEDGRRLVPLSEGRSWGWLVVNYKHYRQLKREEDRREYHRDYWHKRKATQHTQHTQHTQPNQPIAEAEAEAEAEATTTKVVVRATRLPQDWVLPQEWSDWAKSERPDINPNLVASAFRDFWISKAGKDACKRDWQATWRNWVRNQRAAHSRPLQSRIDAQLETAALMTGAKRSSQMEYIDVDTGTLTARRLG